MLFIIYNKKSLNIYSYYIDTYHYVLDCHEMIDYVKYDWLMNDNQM
jgi:hypothetical protein